MELYKLRYNLYNYLIDNNTNYILNENSINYFPFKSYKSQLKAYSKKYCDPFCRRERVIFDYQANEIINFKQTIKMAHKNY